MADEECPCMRERCVCDPDPETTEGPVEDCPRHGRAYSYWVQATGRAEARVRELEERIERARALDAPARILEALEEPPNFNSADFDAGYKFKMTLAYPVISGMDGEYLWWATTEEREQAFARVLAARNLRGTHQAYVDQLNAEPF